MSLVQGFVIDSLGNNVVGSIHGLDNDFPLAIAEVLENCTEVWTEKSHGGRGHGSK